MTTSVLQHLCPKGKGKSEKRRLQSSPLLLSSWFSEHLVHMGPALDVGLAKRVQGMLCEKLSETQNLPSFWKTHVPVGGWKKNQRRCRHGLSKPSVLEGKDIKEKGQMRAERVPE